MNQNPITQPLVSVVLPVYNAGKFLLPAVKSILFQTYKNWELLLIDDCSTDRALDDLIAQVQDSRIKVFRNTNNRGVTARLNQGIELAQGTFLARMDQDDINFPQRFEKQVELLLQNPDLDVVAVGTMLISPDGRGIGYFPLRLTHDEITAHPWQAFYFPHPTWMGRTDWFKAHRYTTCLCEDQGLLLRTYQKSKFATVPDILFAYRLRDTFNFPVIARTRLSCLRQQLKLFLHSHDFHFIFLSSLIFILKLMRDFFIYKILGKSPILLSSRSGLSDQDMLIWNEVSKLALK